MSARASAVLCVGMLLMASGCKTGSYAEQGAVVGGLTGAGLGAGHPPAWQSGAGAVVGAGLGALTGAVVGSGMDQTEARNQAAVSAVEQHAMTIPDVLQMQSAGVDDDVIVTQIRSQGVIRRRPATISSICSSRASAPKSSRHCKLRPKRSPSKNPLGHASWSAQVLWCGPFTSLPPTDLARRGSTPRIIADTGDRNKGEAPLYCGKIGSWGRHVVLRCRRRVNQAIHRSTSPASRWRCPGPGRSRTYR